jgi:ATP-dependent DNA helicase DinG
VEAGERLEPRAVRQIRSAILEAGGNEVFFIGRTGRSGKVEEASVGARGSEDLVPILRPHLSAGDMVIHNHPSGQLSPSRPDIAIASRLGNEGIGFAIVDNGVTGIYVVAEPVAPEEQMRLNADRLAGELAPGGGLARIFPQYEERTSQMEMLRVVAECFNGGEIAALEAGTGVGKSLAYLLPAVAWTAANKDRVVVSTNTINLQQQLVEKDIPLAKKILGEDPKVVLVKGRGNYLCLNRMRDALDELSLFKEEDGELEAIREWARTTETGSRTDLSFFPSDETWSRVCSEADSCLGLRCAFREGCFVLKARREASSARILVANHHLIFSDLALRLEGSGFDDPAVLPPFRRIIFDEAHNIERAASSFFSRVLSRPGIMRAVGRIYRRRKNRVIGQYPALVKILGRKGAVRKIPELAAGIGEKAAALDGACIAIMSDEGSFLLDSEGRVSFSPALEPLEGLFAALTSFTDAIGEILENAPQEEEGVFWDCRVHATRLSGFVELANRFRRGDGGTDEILWMESVKGSGRDRWARLVITPMDIGPLMREAVYGPMKSVVFTSATLTVERRFEYWAARIGLSRLRGRDLVTGVFTSPFDYGENVLLGIPTDAPAPDQPGYGGFISQFVGRALEASRGAGLVLFTSHAFLREIYASVSARLSRHGITILKQGDDDRTRLLERFRADISSVLFATDSFWEGVDAPGQTLQAVILCRLPFRVPTEPVLRARMAVIQERGGNPFTELSLPDAVVRLRQGFGRLMRKSDDRGVILLLDSRVVSKGYGSAFLGSLPDARRVIADSSEVLMAVDAFFGSSSQKKAVLRRPSRS